MSALIATLDEIRNYVAVNAAGNYNTLKPYLRLAERNYLEPVLGFTFLASLELSYAAANKNVENIQDPTRQKVLMLVQEIISNLGLMHAMPVLSVNISTDGVSVIKSADMAPASQWRTNQVLDSLAEVGHKSIDVLLQFLEQHKDVFITWAEDPVYKIYQQYFIRSSTEFNSLYNIRDSRYLFHCIQYCMKRVEAFEIKTAIGTPLFDALKEKDQSGTLPDHLKELLESYLKPAIALFTIAKALQERLISISAGNIAIKFSGATDNSDESRAPEQAELNNTIGSLVADARNWISQAQEFIKDHPLEFAAYAAATSSRRRLDATNDKSKRVFIF